MTNKFSLKCIPFTVAALIALNGCTSDDATPDSSEPLLEIGAATSTDFVAVRVEAENYTDLTGGWTLTSQDNIPTITPDPDPPHFSTAGSGAYVELLPDTRVTHEDLLRNGTNFWNSPGDGPRLEYNVTIPESGRYYVFVKAYSTGPEDNGIHVGINGEQPPSGHRIQLCSGKNKWTWSSAQRIDTNHCGVEKTIFLDVDTAGSHTITFYAREDGYELDQFILLKDLNEGVTNCFPQASDKIRCVDIISGDIIGNYIVDVSPTNDGNVVITQPPPTIAVIDLQLSMSASKEALTLGEEIQFTVNVANLDDSDTATNVQALVTLPGGMTFISSDLCSAANNQLTCVFSELNPDEQVSAVFTASSNIASNLRLDAQVFATQQETTLGNNTASSNIVVSEAIPEYDGALSIIQGPNALGLQDHSTHLISINNKGQQSISDGALELSSNASVSISSSDPSCSGDPILRCLPATIQPGDSISIPVTLSGVSTGLDEVTTLLTVNGDEDSSNNTLKTSAFVIDSSIITDDNGVITLEAESFVAQKTPNAAPLAGAFNSAWFVISDTLSPIITPDFDTVSAEATSNASYVEFLPDTRVGTADPIVQNVSNYQSGGDSSVLSYNVFINTAGRYYLAALIRTNNTQDSSVHFGADDQWPDTSQNLSVCAPNGEWQWTNSVNCGTGNIAYIDITTPGLKTIQLSAATDGVEVDKISLSLDGQELPSGIDSVPVIYSPQDIDLQITGTLDNGIYTVTLTNLDLSNTNGAVVVQLSGIDVSNASLVSGFDGCTANDDVIDCDVNYVAANSHRIASIDIGDNNAEVSVTLISENDNVTTNNKSTTTSSGGGLMDLLFLMLISTLCYVRLFSTKCQRAHQL